MIIGNCNHPSSSLSFVSFRLVSRLLYKYIYISYRTVASIGYRCARARARAYAVARLVRVSPPKETVPFFDIASNVRCCAVLCCNGMVSNDVDSQTPREREREKGEEEGRGFLY